MFVQFIEGQVRDADGLRTQLERWREDVAAESSGWLGTTAGVTADGTAFISARFASAEEARANSDRPEQSAWWAETEKHFAGPVSFEDHDDAETLRGGGSDAAGFVQVIRGTVNDVAAARELLLSEMPDDARPDIIGAITAIRDDGTYTSVIYFTSEEEARAGEAADTEGEFVEQMNALHDSPPRFLDITDPWLWSA